MKRADEAMIKRADKPRPKNLLALPFTCVLWHERICRCPRRPSAVWQKSVDNNRGRGRECNSLRLSSLKCCCCDRLKPVQGESELTWLDGLAWLPHSFSSTADEGSSHEKKSDKSDKKKTTRVRTVLNEKQLHTLRTCYNANPRPDALMKEQLVEMTQLSPRYVLSRLATKKLKLNKQ